MTQIVDHLREGDGVDPREEKRMRMTEHRKGKPNYAILRLAGQIKDAVSDALTMAKDPALDSITVSMVEPSASGTTYTVQVFSTDLSKDYDPQQIREILNAMKPGLRAEVATAVNRKKAPNFTFDVLPPHVQPK
jgi:ribosome-binding factor A